MNLCIDIGNSFIKIAIFDRDEIKYFKSKKDWLVGDLKKLHKKYAYTHCIISTVRNKLPRFWAHLDRNFTCYILDHTLPLPVENRYGTPKTLGKDRIAAAIGAYYMYKKKNNIVIDIGTCMTLDLIDKNGVYLGGNISPGVRLRLKAMHHFTHALPSVKRKNPTKLLGKSTKEAINNGAVFGVALEIDSFVSRMKAEMKHINVILTGGDAAFFGEIVKSKIFVDSFLVLRGLNKLIDYQKEN